ncbi:HAD-IA family hydrolase [candidate division KSB1 bacterium]|nr:HAD-IA family hydrolase [candidate division KSB1 bacterium]
MVEWAFFDIGNVILNDDPAMAQLYFYIFELIQENKRAISFEDMLDFRENSILRNRNGRHHYAVAEEYLGKDIVHKKYKAMLKRLAAEWEQVSPMIDGIRPVIEDAAKHFKLGLIANQPEEVIPILEKNGLMEYFAVNAISAAAGFSKPDMRIFKYALQAAGCQPQQAVMIGDRIDNDIIPAAALGMKTIWVNIPLDSKGYKPSDRLEAMYFNSIRKASASQLKPRNDHEKPDYAVKSMSELMNTLHKIRMN